MCRVFARVRGREVILQTMGYRGKKEARSEFQDLKQARALIMYKADARALGVRTGQVVTVTVGRRRLRCKVLNWSRGSKLLLPSEEYPFADLTREEFEEVRAPPSKRSRSRRRRRK